MDWGDYYKNKDLRLPEFLSNLNRHAQFIEKIASLAENKSILEVGIGSGSMSLFFSWMGFHVTGIDNSESIINQAQTLIDKYGNKNIVNFIKTDAFNLRFEHCQFDVAFSQGFFEHFNDSEIKTLIEQQLFCSKYVALSIPSLWYPNKDFGDERLMKLESWENILSNYSIIDSFYYSQTKRHIRHFLTRKPAQICILLKNL